LAAALPVARNRCHHFTTLATLGNGPAGLPARNRRNNTLAQIK
jgi:hypothetical protein